MVLAEAKDCDWNSATTIYNNMNNANNTFPLYANSLIFYEKYNFKYIF